MVLYALPVYDENGVKQQILLQDGTLGYPHVIVEDELGNLVEIPNVPPEAPPVGQFPVLDENGDEVLIPFEILAATGPGPALRLLCYVGLRVTDRLRMVQLGDQSRVEFDLIDDAGPIDLTGALLLEGKFRRPDNSLLTITGTSSIPTGGTVPSRLTAQFDSGDVNGFGEWLMQAHVILANGREFHGEVRRVLVESNA